MSIFSNKNQNNNASKMPTDAITSIIGEDLSITGHLTSNTSIRIDGKVEGNVNAKNLVVVGEKSEIKGDVSSKVVIVYGKLFGNVHAGELQLKKSGNIQGDINVQALEIEMGGKYNGKLSMSQQQEKLMKEA